MNLIKCDRKQQNLKTSPLRELNSRPPVYKTGALPLS